MRTEISLVERRDLVTSDVLVECRWYSVAI